MKTKNRTAGILALAGIAGGALAWWKYKNMTPEEKAELEGKIKRTGDIIKDSYEDMEDSLTEKIKELKDAVKKEKEKMVS